jgi:plastocyanin
MRRAAILLGLALALAIPAGALGFSSAGTAVGVSEREWRVSLHRTTVPVGVVRLNVSNLGEDGHDLAVRDRRGRVLARSPEVGAGRAATLRVRLRQAGRYTLFCALEEHEARGMRARLRVIARRAPRRR